MQLMKMAHNMYYYTCLTVWRKRSKIEWKPCGNECNVIEEILEQVLRINGPTSQQYHWPMLFTTTTHSDIKCICSTFYISRLSLESMVIKRFGVSPPSHLTISPHFRLRGQPKWLPHRLWWWRKPNLSPVSAVGDASHLTERWNNCHDLPSQSSHSPLSVLSVPDCPMSSVIVSPAFSGLIPRYQPCLSPTCLLCLGDRLPSTPDNGSCLRPACLLSAPISK